MDNPRESTEADPSRMSSRTEFDDIESSAWTVPDAAGAARTVPAAHVMAMVAREITANSHMVVRRGCCGDDEGGGEEGAAQRGIDRTFRTGSHGLDETTGEGVSHRSKAGSETRLHYRKCSGICGSKTRCEKRMLRFEMDL